MAVNSSTPPLHRSLHSRSPLVFFNRTGPGFFTHPPNPRLVSVRSHSQNSAPDGSGSKRSLSLEDSQTSIGSSSSAIDFLTLCHRLKTTKRKGWINNGIKGPESIADHMYRMALMALIAADLPSGLNRERCIKIAIVHDIAEDDREPNEEERDC